MNGSGVPRMITINKLTVFNFLLLILFLIQKMRPASESSFFRLSCVLLGKSLDSSLCLKLRDSAVCLQTFLALLESLLMSEVRGCVVINFLQHRFILWPFYEFHICVRVHSCLVTCKLSSCFVFTTASPPSHGVGTKWLLLLQKFFSHFIAASRVVQ